MQTKLTVALILVSAVAIGCTQTDRTSSNPADVEYWQTIFEGVTDVSTQAATCPAVPETSDTLETAPTFDVMVDWGYACFKACYAVIGGTPFTNCCCHKMCGQSCSDGV
jgi:hypothetical protein